MQMTYELAWAAATDAANRQMRAAGRHAWNREDFNLAVSEYNRLWPESVSEVTVNSN